MNKPTVIQPGDHYGRLTVLRRVEDHVFPNGSKQIRWECECECGTIKAVMSGSLRSGNTRSCGCLDREVASARLFDDITGKRFGRLTVLEFVGRRATNRCSRWLCRCLCGTELVVDGNHLRSGHTASCGCLSVDVTRLRSTRHGFAVDNKLHPLYRTWLSMTNRCDNPANVAYKNYGAKGVTVCERWRGDGGFVNFLEDMGPKPLAPDDWSGKGPYWTLDRIDPTGNYEPENCRWADPKTQAVNKRRS